MTYDEAFIQAIRENPHDDAPRLIYADWLEEHDQADRGEFIRLQCRLCQMSDTDAGASLLMHRAEELLRRHWQEWVGPLRGIVGQRRDRYGESWMGEEYHPDGLHHFQRGFVDGLSLDAESFLRHARTLQCLAPLYSLVLWGGGRCAGTLAKARELKGLSFLSFADYYDAPLRTSDAAALASSPYLDGLSALLLGGNSLSDEGIEALARAPWLVSVTRLDLTDNGLSDRGARALAESPYLSNLRWLDLRSNFLSPEGVAALRNSPNLRSIRRLDHSSQQREVRP